MTKKNIHNIVTIVFCLIHCFGTAQTDTLSFYNTLNNSLTISAEEYPIQVVRIHPQRSGNLIRVTLYMDGPTTGTCKMLLFGHEGGNNKPEFLRPLTEKIIVSKTKIGLEAIEIQLPQSVSINNSQFYIVLNRFIGNFGLKQDTTYQPTFCTSKDGGNYYPTLLMAEDGEWIGVNHPLSLDVVIEYEPKKPSIFVDVTKDVRLPLNLLNHSIAWGDIDNDNWLDLLVGSNLYKNRQGTFQNRSKRLDSYNKKLNKTMSFIDMDNDGDLDLLFLGHKKSKLHINDGKGNFKSKTLRLPPLPSLSAYSIADINKDKYPDIVLAQLWQKYPVPMPNYLFLNNKALNFRDKTKRLYRKHSGQYNYPRRKACKKDVPSTHVPDKNKNKRSRGTQFTDFDLDGDVDLYITNYFLEKDEFYKNNGKGKFKKIAPPSGFPSINQNSKSWYRSRLV